jgi:hypothetical protein
VGTFELNISTNIHLRGMNPCNVKNPKKKINKDLKNRKTSRDPCLGRHLMYVST